jgi:hypothetical protein
MTSKKDLMTGIASQFPSLSTPQSSVISDDSPVESNKSTVINDQLSVMRDKSVVPSDKIDSVLINQAITDARANPRVPLWTPLSKALLRYNQLMRYKQMKNPDMTISQEGSDLLEEIIREKFPELSNLIEEELGDISKKTKRR